MTSGVGLSPQGKSFNMLAIIESWEEEGSYYEDSTGQFLFILLLKVGLNCLVLSMCLRWLHTSFMGVCGLSVFLVDVLLLCAVAAVWFLGSARSPVSICFLLAHASAVFNALPLPMLGLGLLDYASEPRYTTCHDAPCRDLWNYALTLLVWVLAGVHSCCSAVTTLLEVEYEGGRNALGCTVQESVFVVHFSVGISVAICCVMLLHYKQMPLWLKETNRLSVQRDKVNPMLQSHLRFRYAKLQQLGGDEDEQKALSVETERQRPPLYLSLTLDFGTTWASYLVMCIACELLGLAVPAYISINLLWLEFANSVLVGLVFWLKND
uniref:probable G-protein coupled receptor 160 n=1 Tax=Oncorhynchus gorbuscha TaxID=8017 RepID=UPI001EAED0AE|nr:probable G-protein coupled receptor 160 [Oncorhynchus gorbuscha]